MLRRLLLVLGLAWACTAAEPRPATAVESVSITVSDLDRSVAFYTKVLSFEKKSEREIAGEDYERLYGVFGMRARTARLTLGRESIELVEYLAPRGRPVPIDSRGNDLWFQHVAIIVSDMDRAYRVLRDNRVRHASTGPQRLPAWNPNAGGIEAFYFRDPDGHYLEILKFPAGKGDPRWQSSERLFLGIDHTAITVADTEASLAFYRDLLGLRIAGESENYGSEQERLNQVFGARLRITALRTADGPGIELLEYLSPGDGRPYPAGSLANDLWHWHTRIAAPNADEAARRLRMRRTRFVSSALVAPEGEPEYRKSVLVRDPDGHAVQIVEK